MSTAALKFVAHPRTALLWVAVLSTVFAVALVAEAYAVIGALLAVPLIIGAFLYPVVALAGMMVFIPIEGFASLVPGAFTLPRLIGVLTFACFLANRFLHRKAIHRDVTTNYFAMFVAWCFLSAFWAADSSAAYVMIFVMFQLFLFYTMCENLLADPKALRLTLFFYIIGCVVASYLAMRNYADRSFATNMQRVSAVEDMNPNDFARMVGFGMLAGLFLLFDSTAKWMRNFVLAAFPILLIGLVLSKGRGAWLAFLVALLTVFLVIRKTTRTYIAGAAVLLLLVLSIGAGFHFGYFDEGLQERLEQTTDGKDPTAQRADIWKVGFALAAANPIAGVGFNNFHVRFNEYLSSVQTDVFPGFNKDPHNVFLSVLGETGLVGFALFGAIFWIILRRIIRAGRNWDSAMAAAFVVFTAVSGLSGTDHIRKWFWVSLVAALLLAKRHHDARTGT